MKKWVGFVVLIMFSRGGALGEESLTWDSCVQMALQQNPDLQAAQKSVESRRASYLGSYNGLMPQLSLSSGYYDSKNATGANRWRASGQASLDLFNPARYASIQSNSASLNQAEANYRLTATTILYNLRQAFARLLFSQKEVEVSTQIKDIRDKNSDLVTLRYKSGRESKGNMLRSQAEQLQAQVNLNQSRRDLRAAQQELLRQLGQKEFKALITVGELGYDKTEPIPENWDPITNAHPTVHIQEKNVASAKASLRQAQSSLYPTISANFNKSYSDEQFFPNQNSDWSASGVLSVPIFSGGPTANFYSVSSANKNLEKAQEDLRSARNQVQSDLESAWSNLAGAMDQEKVQQAFLEAARQRNGEADIRYSSGLLSFEDWSLIVTDRVNYELSLIRAKRDALLAAAQWERALGHGLGE